MSDRLEWDKISNKDVRGAWGEKIGKVKSISPDFVEVQKGKNNEDRYFIPKYYFEGYDKDDLCLSSQFTSTDQVRNRFAGEKPPTESEIRTAEYLELMSEVNARSPEFVYGLPHISREPDTEIPVDYSGTTYDIPWDKLIHQHVRGNDNVEIGYVQRIGDEFIVVHPGAGSSSKTYYVPKTYIRDFDGSQLFIDAPSDLVVSKFVTETKEPSREELRSMARDAPRLRRQSDAAPEASTSTRGPSVLWDELRGKNVKTSDGKTLGEIKESSVNYLRIEKGSIKKENKFWIPKFMFDIYDGKSAWLVTTEEETLQYLKNEPNAADDYNRDFQTFKNARPSIAEQEYSAGLRSRNESIEK